MGALRDFVADVLEIEGAAIEPLEPDGLEVLSRPSRCASAMGWPELARLGFGAELPERRNADRTRRRLARPLRRAARRPRPLGRAAARARRPPFRHRAIPNACSIAPSICPMRSGASSGAAPAWTRCLLLAFRYTAVSDEKREGLVWLGFNQGTGAVLDDMLARLLPLLARSMRVASARAGGAPGGRHRLGCSRACRRGSRPLLEHQVRRELEPFLRAMRRRLDRDRSARPCLSQRSAARRAEEAGGARRQLRAKRRRLTAGARRCGSQRSSANTPPSSTICATITRCASRSNGFRHWNCSCRCSASRC